MSNLNPVQWEGKVWGHTALIARTETFEVHSLQIQSGGYCSIHRHTKLNLFHVIKGYLLVSTFEVENGKGAWKHTAIGANESLIVPSGVWHRFHATVDCRVLEIYWMGAVTPTDIERITMGGLSHDRVPLETPPTFEA